jgi:ectoine hydroxylase-related dioxygenase (phytanoyl-CoA dioxygenase family)
MAPLEYILGSHKWPLAAKPTRFSDGDESDWMEVVEPVRPPGTKMELATVIVPAGGGAFHHTMLLHGSRRNNSDNPRRAIALHYAAEGCRARLSSAPWHPAMWEGVVEDGRIANQYMPIVYP